MNRNNECVCKVTSAITHLAGLELNRDDMSYALMQKLDGNTEVGHGVCICVSEQVVGQSTYSIRASPSMAKVVEHDVAAAPRAGDAHANSS